MLPSVGRSDVWQGEGGGGYCTAMAHVFLDVGGGKGAEAYSGGRRLDFPRKILKK